MVAGSASLEQFRLENTASRIANHGRCNRLTSGWRFGRKLASPSGGRGVLSYVVLFVLVCKGYRNVLTEGLSPPESGQ